MPFENSGPDARRDDLAADITREVTNHILKGADGPVIAGMAAEAYQGKPIDPRAIGCEHDVHFVLTGNARREDGRLIVTAVLCETAGGGPVWGRQLDVPDGPDALPTLAQVIYENAWQKSVDLEAWHAVHDHPDHLDKRDLILIALSTPLWSPTKANYLEKLSLVDRALALDPNYLRAFERRARLLVEFVLLGYSSDPVADLAMATEAADHALAIDPHAQLSLRVKAAVLRAHGHWTEAEAVQREVLSLKPTESFRHYELGLILMAQGRHEEAWASLQTARRSAGGNNPLYCYDAEIAMANLALGRLAEAEAKARLAIGEMPRDIGRSEELPWLALIAATALSGNEKAARTDLQKFLAAPRSWHSMSEVRKWAAFATNPKLLEGLRRAGMPEESIGSTAL
jgi:TolB-like protein